MKIKYWNIILSLFISTILFYGASAFAWDRQFEVGGLICNKKGFSGICTFSSLPGNGGQAYRIYGSAHLEGHGSFGGAGGVGGFSVCLTRSYQMWDGSCWNVVHNYRVGDGNADFIWDREIGNDFYVNYFVGMAEFYANDATWSDITIGIYARRVEITNFNVPGSVNFGDTITVSWNTDQSLDTYLFTDEGVPSSYSQSVNLNGSINFTANTCGNCTAYFTLRACGPSGGGWTCAEVDETTSIGPPPPPPQKPGSFSLSGVCQSLNSSQNRANLSWTNSQYAEKYQIWHREWSNGTIRYLGETTLTSFSDTIRNDIDYYYRVKAINSNGETIGAPDWLLVCQALPEPSVDIKANGSDGPINIQFGSSATLSWTSSNTNDSCVASGDWSGPKPANGSESTGNLTSSKNYILTCSGLSSHYSPVSDNVQVNVNPPPPTTSNVTVTVPDYCTTGPSAWVSWDFSDPSGGPQSAYQVQIDNQPNFSSPEFDSGIIACGNCRWHYGGLGFLQFNTTYSARVRTWNNNNPPSVSSWQVATFCNGTGCEPNGSWKTPIHAYPNVNLPHQFTWLPAKPTKNMPVQFIDHGWFDASSNNKQWLWTFVPAGGGSGSSTAQNPVYTFNSDGIYQVTESVRDNAMPPGQYCSYTQSVSIQKSIPIWKEIAPR
jgi:hypothetical protein